MPEKVPLAENRATSKFRKRLVLDRHPCGRRPLQTRGADGKL